MKEIILSEDYPTLPNRIQINNGDSIQPLTKEQNLESDTNIIKMIWNDQLTTCKNMFKNLSHIISIDLTNFNFSSVSDMEAFLKDAPLCNQLI